MSAVTCVAACVLECRDERAHTVQTDRGSPRRSRLWQAVRSKRWLCVGLCRVRAAPPRAPARGGGPRLHARAPRGRAARA